MKRFTYQSVVLRGIMAAGLVAAFVSGCDGPPSRLNAPPQGSSQKPHDMQEPFVHMTDNAMLEDMSMSAVHFVPHTSELNALGVRRLKRFATILKVYGGTLRYDGVEDSDILAADRIEHISGLLIAEGVDEGGIEVERDLSGGSGMRASEAIVIRADTTYKPGQNEAKEDPAAAGIVAGQKAQ